MGDCQGVRQGRDGKEEEEVRSTGKEGEEGKGEKEKIVSKVSENERERESCMNLSREIIRKTKEKRKENERFGGGRKKKE